MDNKLPTPEDKIVQGLEEVRSPISQLLHDCWNKDLISGIEMAFERRRISRLKNATVAKAVESASHDEVEDQPLDASGPDVPNRPSNELTDMDRDIISLERDLLASSMVEFSRDDGLNTMVLWFILMLKEKEEGTYIPDLDYNATDYAKELFQWGVHMSQLDLPDNINVSIASDGSGYLKYIGNKGKRCEVTINSNGGYTVRAQNESVVDEEQGGGNQSSSIPPSPFAPVDKSAEENQIGVRGGGVVNSVIGGRYTSPVASKSGPKALEQSEPSIAEPELQQEVFRSERTEQLVVVSAPVQPVIEPEPQLVVSVPAQLVVEPEIQSEAQPEQPVVELAAPEPDVEPEQPVAEPEQLAAELEATEAVQGDTAIVDKQDIISIHSPEAEATYNTAVSMFGRLVTLESTAVDLEALMQMENPPSFADFILDPITLFRWTKSLENAKSEKSEFEISMSTRRQTGDPFMTCEIYNVATGERYQFTYFTEREEISFDYEMHESRFPTEDDQPNGESSVDIDNVPLDAVVQDLLQPKKP